MGLNDKSGKAIREAIERFVKSLVRTDVQKAPFNKTKNGRIVSVTPTGYTVEIENKVYPNMLSVNGATLTEGDVVVCELPNNQMSQSYILGKLVSNIKNPAQANNGLLTLKKNGSEIGRFSANQSTDTDINIVVPTKTSELENDSNFVTSNTLSTELSKKVNDMTIGIYNGTAGNPKPVKILSIDYTNCDSENGVFVKISMVSGHGNGVSYAFLQDSFFNVDYNGNVSVQSYKYFGANITYNGVARQYGDIFWVNDTTNKIVDFYILMGQYATVYSSPYKRLNASTKGVIDQGTTLSIYSSGTQSWANQSDIARLQDIENYIESKMPICFTDGSTSSKTVTIDNFTLRDGGMINVYFVNANRASGITLNINNTGAKAVQIDGGAVTAANFDAGWHTFYYDGTYYNTGTSLLPSAANVVTLTGNQTISGTKTFNSAIVSNNGMTSGTTTRLASDLGWTRKQSFSIATGSSLKVPFSTNSHYRIYFETAPMSLQTYGDLDITFRYLDRSGAVQTTKSPIILKGAFADIVTSSSTGVYGTVSIDGFSAAHMSPLIADVNLSDGIKIIAYSGVGCFGVIYEFHGTNNA